MKLITKSLILFSVVIFYAFLYIATQPPDSYRCDEDCQRVFRLDTMLSNRFSYIYGVGRCTARPADSICIYLRDTTGIDWNRFADTVCSFANSVGLYRQRILLIRQGVAAPADTVARKNCP